jgi:hypothetical protein
MKHGKPHGAVEKTNQRPVTDRPGAMGWPERLVLLGANKQKALKFHRILANLLQIKAYKRFLVSQILTVFRCCFLRTYNSTESTFPYELK